MTIYNIFSVNIDYFLRCAEFSSFVNAARHIGLTQSALSKAIQTLESDLNVTLFLRTKKGIHLTEAGKALYQEFAQGRRRLQDRVRSITEATYRPRLRIGSAPHFAVRYLFSALKKLKEFECDQIFSASSLECKKAVLEGKLDCAFCALTEKPTDVESLFIKDDPFAIVGLRSKYAHIEKTRSIEDLANEVWIDNALSNHDWRILTHPGHETFIANDSLTSNHLILNGYGIGAIQLDFFSPVEQKLLARAPFSPGGNSPGRSFFPPVHDPKIYLVYRPEIGESMREYLKALEQVFKRA